MESIFKIKLMNGICRSENMKKKNTSEKI
ncbi:TPA: hypothetical protein ACU1RX_001434 [Staphylococcus aureus]|nr:hypothetical protein [Staphylococcus aureus]MBU9768597.1 hypothetical protein [Staphylococcus aureus]MCE5081934.1 hypothetical protein [Staphylococcus aureus]MCE5087884.1 hypothetical protein [Staphylococcus aureus]MCE5133532.1 hypothetical protein [Staphylococcus aureus]MCE5136144.1 hypothetical protein [Staphylococcus aureus]